MLCWLLSIFSLVCRLLLLLGCLIVPLTAGVTSSMALDFPGNQDIPLIVVGGGWGGGGLVLRLIG